MAGREKTWAVLAVVSGLAAAGCNGFGTNCSTDADCQAQNPVSVCDPTLKVCFVYSGPAVTNISPADKATRVAAAGASVVATFSEPIVDSGVTSDTFMVVGQGFQPPGTYSFNVGNTEATFLPAGDSLALGTQYTVTLTSAIQDASGNALLPFTSTFSTVDGSWRLGDATQYNPGPNVDYFSIASNYSGNLVTAATVGIIDTATEIDHGVSAGVSAAGGIPTLPNTPNLQDTELQFASSPSAGSAVDGTGLVAWVTNSSDAGAPLVYDALAAVYDPVEQTWGAAYRFEHASPNSPYPQIVGLQPGEGLVLWLHTNQPPPADNGNQIVWADYFAEGAWLGAGPIQTDQTLNSYGLVLSGNRHGVALAAWESEQATADAGPLQIVGYYLPGPSFPGSVPLPTPGLDSVRPMTALGPENLGAVVWMAGSEPSDGGLEVFHIYASTVDPRQTPVFSSPVQIDNSTGTARFPHVGVAGNGNAVAIWQEYSAAGVYSVVSSVYDYVGKTWSAPFTLDMSGAMAVYGPAVAVDPGGNALAAWFEGGTDPTRQVFGGRYTPDAGWHDIGQLTTGGGDAIQNVQLQIVVDGFGHGWEGHFLIPVDGDYYLEFIPFQ